MFDKIKSLLKQPSTYVILVIGAILGLAYGSRAAFLKKVASNLPKSDA